MWHTLRNHWPEYLIEAWALGTFMLSAGFVAILLEHPASPLYAAIPDPTWRRVLGAVAMGLTAIALIYSPWGKRSGAHMNPAITLTFLRLGHIARRDAFFYILAQFIGGTLGVLIVLALEGEAFSVPPVSYVQTVPGPAGAGVAFAAEMLISFLMMSTVLRASSSPKYMPYTGLFAGSLVALFIAFEAPLSGMSMNPARTFASAFPASAWTPYWIYVLAPIIAMQLAASLHVRTRGASSAGCAKLMHVDDQRCIHCGYEPAPTARTASTP